MANWVRDVAKGLTVRGTASAADVSELAASLGHPLPADYVELAQVADGAEGWIGDDYIALWPLAEILDKNAELRVETYAPGLLLIGTDGGGEAFAFDMRTEPWPIVMVPLVGLSRDLAQHIANSFSSWLAPRTTTSDKNPRGGDRLFGMNVYDINPVILGGNPTDPANKSIVSLAELIKMATWWNARIAEQQRRLKD